MGLLNSTHAPPRRLLTVDQIPQGHNTQLAFQNQELCLLKHAPVRFWLLRKDDNNQFALIPINDRDKWGHQSNIHGRF